MAKPIFLIGLPYKRVHQAQIYDIQKSLESKFTDYYTLVYTQHNVEDVLFNVFYEKDFNEIKYEELKEIVRQEYDNNKP